MVSDTTQLKLTASDGKKYNTDVISQAVVKAHAKSIRNPKMCVDWSKIDMREYLDAMIATYTSDSSRIRELLKQALTDRIDDREIFMKGIDDSYYYEENE